eukprot:461799_1
MALILPIISLTILTTSVSSLTCTNNQYKAIDIRATDDWCMSNCNHNPPYCPDGFCACDSTSNGPSTTDTSGTCIWGYKAISPSATDFWCESNCNHNPPYCPTNMCACDAPTTSPTKRPTLPPTTRPTNNPTNITPAPTPPTPKPTNNPTNNTPIPTKLPTQTPTIRPTIAGECYNNKYRAIDTRATDQWCNDNCNHNPSYCPDNFCVCAGPTVSPTTPYPTSETYTPTKRPIDCAECPICEGMPTRAPIPTLSPTPRIIDPFEEHCNCICFGDPHCKMWNCHQNNWQGPHGVYPPGQVYYMTRCNGESLDKMPFDVIASIQRYSNDFTSIDYSIIKIYNPNDENDFYCVKIKGNEGVKYNNDCSDNYNEIPNQNDIFSFFNKFHFKWYYGNGNTQLTLNIDGDECQNDIQIISQTVWSKEEGVEIKVSDCYKRSTCGICGNFYDPGLYFERIDGTHMTLSEGCWGGTANDETGLSYLLPGTMGNRRQLQIVNEEKDEPCFGLIDDIETECKSGLEEYSECCSTRSDFCDDDIVLGCKWDSCSCVMTEADSLINVHNNGIVNECVSKILSNAMNFTCNLPADEFKIPDMSVYENDENQQNLLSNGNDANIECDDNSVSSIFIGIAIGCVICIIINVIIYFFVLKPIFSKPYVAVDENDNDNENQAEQEQLM